MADDKNQTISDLIANNVGSRARKLIQAAIVCIPILIIFVQVYYGLSVIKNVEERTTNTINTIKSNKYDLIASVIRENYKHAKLQTETIKFNIVRELALEYKGNLEYMYQDYSKKDFNVPFYQIISKTINERYLNRDTSHNRVFIANRSHILLDNSAMYHHNSFTEWKSVIDNLEDGRILTKSLMLMTHDNDDFILWIDNDNSQFGRIIKDDILEDMTISGFISECVMNDKMIEMKHFSIAVVSFIFEHRDLFDVPDIQNGTIMNNDKLYVIEVFNIGDVIDTNQDMSVILAKYDTAIKLEKVYCIQLVESRVTMTVILVALTVVLFFGIWYLVEYQIFGCKLRGNEK